jgi:hypothetical protein
VISRAGAGAGAGAGSALALLLGVPPLEAGGVAANVLLDGLCTCKPEGRDAGGANADAPLRSTAARS